ncbi:MAG: hypothetical protein QM766_08095 [Burkholderiaceae bacterium]
MKSNPGLFDTETAETIERIHASDVMRARELIQQAVAAAYAEWLPRNATVEALISVLQEQANGGGIDVGYPGSGRLS